MKYETKVGLLFIGTLGAVILFAYAIGAINPFSNANKVNLLYNFAGGIELGSPVRVMGIKVGKVEDIQFDPDRKDEAGDEVKLVITVSIDKKAWTTVREDSRFYINLAGVIGEKYIEVTPGTSSAPMLKEGGYYRGFDPPRVDQLISQSYALAGKVLEFVESNEEDVSSILNSLDGLVTNVARLTKLMNDATGKKEVGQLSVLLKNMTQISGDFAHVSKRLRTPQSDKTVDLVHDLIWRLDELDKQAIKKFFQDEGIKASIF